MLNKYFFNITAALLVVTSATAQATDTLPNFSITKTREALTQIQWYNDYGVVKQITIQRSTDSLKRFASLQSIDNAMAKRNFFIDLKSKNQNYYYRLFVQLPEGQYFYTISKRAIKPIYVPIGVTNTNINIGTDTANKLKAFVPSEYIYTDKKNNVLLQLPDAENKNYTVTFYEEDGSEIFTLTKIPESSLILEKVNFGHSGWFNYTITLGGKVVERYKFYIAREKP